MELVFAKWIFTAAAVLNGSTDLPFLKEVTPQQVNIFTSTEVYENFVKEPCHPGANVCPGPLFVARHRQLLCTNPGVYTVTTRMGLLAPWGAVSGKLWLVAPGGSEALLAAFQAAPGAPAYVGASLQVASPAYGSCYRVRFESNGPVEVVADQGVSFVTIGR